MSAVHQETQCIEYVVGQCISKIVDTATYKADPDQVAIDSYAWLGVAQMPTKICSFKTVAAGLIQYAPKRGCEDWSSETPTRPVEHVPAPFGPITPRQYVAV